VGNGFFRSQINRFSKYSTKRPNTIVLLGDSITANNGSGDFMTTGTSFYFSDFGYFTWANVLLGQRLRVLDIVGLSGSTTEEILAVVESGVLPLQPGWCFVLAGVNDAVAGLTYSTVIEHIKTIFDKLNANNIGVIVSTICPRDSSSTSQDIIDKVNSWLRWTALNDPNIILVDMRKAVIDNTTDLWVANASDDNLHPQQYGAYLMGEEAAKVLDLIIPAIDIFGCDASNSALINSNPLMTGGTTLATSWGKQDTGYTATYSKVARTDGKHGTWQQVAISAVPE
jgi:lysophospholipase L1-like esterase